MCTRKEITLIIHLYIFVLGMRIISKWDCRKWISEKRLINDEGENKINLINNNDDESGNNIEEIFF